MKTAKVKTKDKGNETNSRGLTAEQSRAVDTRAVSVALSAGAGCGKTFVLTERFLAYFRPGDPQELAPSELGRLVAITFTERAAREMRDRIRRKCYEFQAAAGPAEAAHWAELLRWLDNARISTIHSFCGALLRTRAVEAGVDPRFEVLEQSQAETLLSEIIDDELRRLIAQRDEIALNLAARFDLDVLRTMLRGFARAAAGEQFAAWLKVDPGEQVARWQAFYRQEVVPAVARDISRSASAEKLLAIMRDETPTNAVMRERCRVLAEKLAGLEQAASGASLEADFEEIQTNARVQGGGTAKAWSSAQVYDEFKNAATKLRELVKQTAPLAIFDPAGAREAAVVGGQLLSIADRVRQAYARRKQELAVLDFNDLVSGARNLLTDPRHADMQARLASQIRLLLVDEFQDTDPAQVELVSALCGSDVMAGKLFFVGDLKQSIYRFRGADPRVFRSLRERTPKDGRQSLPRNFRSQPAILEFVNALFWHDLGPDYEPLRPSREQVAPRPAVEFLWAAAPAPGKEKREIQLRREATWIARRVRALIDSQQPIVWDAAAAERGQPAARNAKPGDFAILFRALSNVEFYEDALRRHGLDYYLVGGHAFYAQQEIFDLVNLLRALNSAADAVSLVGVLRSGFFSLKDETIFWLSGHADGVAGGLFAADYPSEISSGERQRVRFAAATIAELRASKDRLRISELIELALERTGYDAVLLNEFLGQRKLANLRKLIEQARAFERGGFFGLSDFIAQLTQFVAHQPDEPLAATHSEDTDVVRLMTIHQAKGLEFPIVIVPDVDRKRNDSSAPAHFDARLGPLVRLPTTTDAEPCPGGYELWRFMERFEDSDELNRLLYVATTRAADYLILSSGATAAGASGGPWTELVARRLDLLSGRLVGPLPPKEPHPQILVTTEEPPAPKTDRAARPRFDLDKTIADVLSAKTISDSVARSIDPIAPDLSERRQYSFSRLSGRLHVAEEQPLDVELDAERPLDPRGLGTVVHAVLAAMDFGKSMDLPALVRVHAERHLADGSRDAGEALAMVERFAASARARELAAAAECHAEIEFLLAWPPDGSGPRKLSVSGTIDRLYRDAAGDWHVLDFKTNRVARGNLTPLAAAYEMQMLLYALATERIVGKAPKSLTLCFLRSGAEHSFQWNAEARDRVVAMVSGAIAEASRSPVREPHLIGR